MCIKSVSLLINIIYIIYICINIFCLGYLRPMTNESVTNDTDQETLLMSGLICSPVSVGSIGPVLIMCRINRSLHQNAHNAHRMCVTYN